MLPFILKEIETETKTINLLNRTITENESVIKNVRHRKQQKNNSAKLRSWKTPLPQKGKKCPPPEQTTKSPSSSQQVENTIPAGNTQLDSIVVVVEVVVNSQEARENETKRGRKKDKGKKITCRKPAGRRELNDRVLITV